MFLLILCFDSDGTFFSFCRAAQAYAGARPASASVGRSTRGVSTPGMLPPSRPTSASVATRSTGLPSTYSAPTAGTTPTYRQLHGDGGFNNHQEVWGSRGKFSCNSVLATNHRTLLTIFFWNQIVLMWALTSTLEMASRSMPLQLWIIPICDLRHHCNTQVETS